jgi:hypothetical protein
MNRRGFFAQGSLLAIAGAFPPVLADLAAEKRKEHIQMVEKILVPHTSIHRIEATVFLSSTVKRARRMRQWFSYCMVFPRLRFSTVN